MKIRKIDIREIDGFKLGNAENRDAGTGCTVIISEKGAVAGVDVRGGAPATRETDLLKSENTVDKINAVVLSGGSAFGLEAASGVMRSLAAREVGFKVGEISVPIVAGASLFDLAVGSQDVFPDVEMGRQAVSNAYRGDFEEGNHGAGTGASCGKMLGMNRAMKTGLGTFACGDDLVQVGAVVAVNAVADVYNGAGNIIAGLRTEDGSGIYGTIKVLKESIHPEQSDEISFDELIPKKEEPAIQIKPLEQSESSESDNKTDSRSEIARAIEEAYKLASLEQASPEIAAEEPVNEPEPAVEPAVEPAAEVLAEPVPVQEFTPEPLAESIIVQETVSEPVSVSAPIAETVENEPAAEEEPAVIINDQPTVPEPVTEECVPADPVSAFEAEPAPVSVEETVPVSEPVAEPEYIQPAVIAENTPSVPEHAAEEVKAEEEPQTIDPVVPTEEVTPEPEPDPYELSEEEKADMGYDIPFNTTIACVITNAELTKSQANKLATILHDAYARAIKPVHSTMDGDTIFVMSTCTQKVNFDAFAALATDVLQYAIIDGAMKADSAYGLPAAKDIIHK